MITFLTVSIGEMCDKFGISVLSKRVLPRFYFPTTSSMAPLDSSYRRTRRLTISVHSMTWLGVSEVSTTSSSSPDFFLAVFDPS